MASSRLRSASSMLSAISARRFSIAGPTGPKTYRFRMNRVIPKITSVQIIRPGLASRSGLPPSSPLSAWSGRTYAASVPIESTT